MADASTCYLLASHILKPRGLKGEIKCAGFSPVPAVVIINDTEYRVKNASDYDGFTYLFLEGVDTIERAELLRGRDIFVRRADIELADDEILVGDLVGYTIIDEAGKTHGTVRAVENYGAGEIIEATGANGAFSFPYEDAFVVETHTKKRTLCVRPSVFQ